MPAPLGGNPHKLLEGMQGVQWSPDGKQLAYSLPGSSAGDALIVADADGSRPREIVTAAGGRHVHWPTWSRDGQHLYFIYTFQPWNTEQSGIYRVPAAGGAPEAVVQSIRRAVYPVPLPEEICCSPPTPKAWTWACGGNRAAAALPLRSRPALASTPKRVSRPTGDASCPWSSTSGNRSSPST